MLKRSHHYAIPLLLASFTNLLTIYQSEVRKLEEADARHLQLVEDLNRQRLTLPPAGDRERRADAAAARLRGAEVGSTPARNHATPGREAPLGCKTPGCAVDHQDFTAREACEADPK
jgi:hypothetical protein